MNTQTITTFLFSELNEKAKEFALNKYRELGISDYWYEDTYEYAKEHGLRITGFDLDRRQSINGEFIWSEIEVADKIMDVYGIDAEIYKTAQQFRKERDELCDHWQFIDGAPINEDELEDKLNELEHKFEKDVLWHYWLFLRNEYEYLFSDEFLADHFDNNEYQFIENGKLFNF